MASFALKQQSLRFRRSRRSRRKAISVILEAHGRVDIPAKVKGTAVYGLDVSVPGMLYAVLARPPAYGAKPVSSNEKAALQ